MRNLVLLAALAASTAAFAQNSAPLAIPPVYSVPAARDVPYPGTMQLEVDVTDSDRAIMKVRQLIPVAAAGDLVLLLPRWLPGAHGPDQKPDKLAGLEIRTAEGAILPWVRDTVETSGYRVNVPAGTRAIEARFQFVSPTQPNQGRIVMTPSITNVQWENVSLYPAGYYTRRIPVEATLVLPTGWQAATALRPNGAAAGSGNRIRYGTVSYETLVDSPVFAGRYFRKDDLGHGVTLNSVADAPEELKIPANVLAKHRGMVDQAIKLFGARHYDHYDFLNAVTDELGGIGLEHHRSTEIDSSLGYYTEYDKRMYDRNVFPHEFVHSWDGKFRRGADLFTPDYQTPMRNSLLWVYEGQTQFWGTVLEARGGMTSKQDILDRLAMTAAGLDTQPGKAWRPLLDTTNDPIIQNRAPEPWGSYQRSEDYYNEGMLIWLEADAIIRSGTKNRRGMDDFAKAFFGIRDGDWGTVTYTREDVIATLNRIHPYDWTTFLHERVDQVRPRAPLEGFTRSGYQLTYTDEPTSAWKAREALGGNVDLSYSLGFTAKGGKLTGVKWGSPAFAAALRTGDELVAIGERAYSDDALRNVIRDAKGTTAPIRLTYKRGNAVRTVAIPYADGLRYPRFTKVGKTKGALDILLEPK
ncbi:M61 family metallopeptidase [Sphingomonas swuensis]|uniref:M61 family metallopeptidase n=1 Tax=Sphingomonas swuensis TaxID=977800 RepID=A0ABP7SBM7_9SPHN